MKYLKITVIVLVFLFYLITPALSVESSLRIVIFPFENISGDKNYNWIGNSFAETLTVGLTKVSSLTILERSQINKIVKEQAFNTTGFVNDQNAIEMGKILSANIVVLGSFHIIGNQIKIIARFVDILTGEVQKGHTADVAGEISNLFNLQNQLADKLIATFNISVSKEESSEVSNIINSTNSLPAYEYYIKAKELINSTGGATALNNAVDWLKKSIEADSKFVFAYIELSNAYNNLAQWHFANIEQQKQFKNLCLEYAQKAVEIKSDIPASHRVLSQAYNNLNKWQEALDEIKIALKIQPDNIDNIILYLKLTKQDIETSIKELQKYVSINEDNPSLNFFLADQYLTLGKNNPDNINKAIFYLQKIVDKYPDNYYVHIMLDAAYIMQDKDELAEQHLQKAVQIDPKSFLTQYKIGIFYLRKGEVDKAENAFKIAMEIDPQCTYVHNFLGVIYKSQKKYEQALEIFNQAIKIDPTFDPPYWGISDVYILQQRYDLAEATLLKGLKEAPASIKIYHKLGEFYQKQKMYTEAIEILTKSLEITEIRKQKYKFSQAVTNKEKSQTYMKIGNVYKIQNQSDKTIEAYNKAKKLTPDNTEIYNALADVYIAKKDIKTALLNFQKIVELEQENATAHYNVGNALMLLKQNEKAKTSFLNALKYKPDFVKAHYNLGVIYWQEGKYKESAKEWQETLKLDPKHQGAKTWLPKALEKLKD